MLLSAETIAALNADLVALPAQSSEIVELYVERAFANDRAREFARHGVCRRLRTMCRCVQRAFALIPADQVDVPNSEIRTDAEILIQAFLFNAVGTLDNLAWMYVAETGLNKPSGAALGKREIGLGRSRTIVRDSFSVAFKASLVQLDDWFDHLEDYRHALAHRIPLYIVPFFLEGDAAEEFEKLDLAKAAALHDQDFDRYDSLVGEQNQLRTFRPLIMHSFEEQARRVFFHPQMLSDLRQVNDLAVGVLKELPNPNP